MLIEFEVGNYRSVKTPVRLSMLSAKPIKEFQDKNTFKAGERHTLLKSAVIYGANASGKSNLLAAMDFMKGFVFNSFKETQIEEEIPVMPFRLDASSENEPSHFEICFIQQGKRYRYGFEVDRNAVKKEWLFQAERKREEPLFLRDGEDIEISDEFPEGKGIEGKTRNNALFLSVVAQFNGEIAGKILRWFKALKYLQGSQDRRYEGYSTEMLKSETMRPLLVEFVRGADVGISDFSEIPLEDEELKEFPNALQRLIKGKKSYRILTVHATFHDGNPQGSTRFDFSDESEGTKKLFRIAGPILDCLKNGYVLVVDELDSKLHPLLTKAIVHLFNSNASNPKNAQLIFATHDTNLLQHGDLRRDQIWFTEKTEQSATSLYSLAEFKLPKGVKVRNDAALEKNYIQGRYGAIPFIGDFEALLKENELGPSRKVE